MLDTSLDSRQWAAINSYSWTRGTGARGYCLEEDIIYKGLQVCMAVSTFGSFTVIAPHIGWFARLFYDTAVCEYTAHIPVRRCYKYCCTIPGIQHFTRSFTFGITKIINYPDENANGTKHYRNVRHQRDLPTSQEYSQHAQDSSKL